MILAQGHHPVAWADPLSHPSDPAHRPAPAVSPVNELAPASPLREEQGHRGLFSLPAAVVQVRDPAKPCLNILSGSLLISIS